MRTFIMYQLLALAIEIIVGVLLRYLNIWLYKLRKKGSGTTRRGGAFASESIVLANYLREVTTDLMKRHLLRGLRLSF